MEIKFLNHNNFFERRIVFKEKSRESGNPYQRFWNKTYETGSNILDIVDDNLKNLKIRSNPQEQKEKWSKLKTTLRKIFYDTETANTITSDEINRGGYLFGKI